MSGSESAPLLVIDAVTKRFGGVVALNGVSFGLEANTVVGLIGPNGSGKTTLLNVINGVVAADEGEVRLGEATIGGKRPDHAGLPDAHRDAEPVCSSSASARARTGKGYNAGE